MGRLTMPANEVARYALHMADHPEAAPGPHDSLYLFDRFVEAMTRRAKQASTDA